MKKSQKVDEQPKIPLIGHQSSSQEVGEQSYELRRSTRVRKAKILRSDEIDSQNISFYLVEGTNKRVLKT
ncbi:hypothetical protein ACT03K_23680, partial [Enterobacter kobei]|uniref:hypothetical protein n=1 Tax=Enterobacter kobei TaxID=208224 RepID=UPI00402AE7D1